MGEARTTSGRQLKQRGSRKGRVRWQLVVLGVGLLLIVGAVVYMLARPTDRRPAQVEIAFDTGEDTFREAIVGEPLLVNPLLADSPADRDLVLLIFSGLTTIDEYGQPVPDLAEGWEVSAGGTTYTFRLRSGVTWHDGEPFTAEDVAFTMSLLRDPAFPGPADLGAFWRTVETYADDETTVRFILTQPLVSFPEYAGIGILPAHLLEGIDPATLAGQPFNLAPIGTGRLRWVSLGEQRSTTIVTLEPHRTFYDVSRRVSIPRFEFRFYPDARRAFNALGDDVYAVGGLTPAQLDAALSSTSLDVYSAYLPVYGAIIFNQQEPDRLPFFQVEDVRRGLTAALDRQALIDEYLPRQALLAETPIVPGSWAYYPDTHQAAYDPVAADLLFNQAEWVLSDGDVRARGGVRLAFTLLVSDHPVERKMGQAIVEKWRAVGADVTLQAIDAEDLRARLADRSFDAALVEFGQGGLADPDPYSFWHQAQIVEGQNYSGLDDRDISWALELARKEPNGVRRVELYRDFQTWFNERAAAILLYYPAYHYTVSCQVRGVQVALLRGPDDRFLNLHEWRFATPAELEEVCGN